MKEYDVTITETLEKKVTVEADSREEAEAMVREGWNNSDYILDAENFTGVDFSVGEEREIAHDKADKMSVLLVSPEQYPKQVEIGTGLESLQAAVGGDIEAIYPFDDDVALVMNEEGKLNGLALNRCLYTEDGDIYDVIAGDFLIVGLAEESFGSLTPEQMAHYEEAFHQPEMFVKMGRSIMALPLPDDMVKTGGEKADKAHDARPKPQER